MVSADPLAALIVGLSLLAVLTLSCVSDLRERRIPNRVLIVGSSTVLVSLAILSPQELPGHLLWATLVSIPFATISILRPEAMGMGDAKLVLFLGISLGHLVGEVVLVALALGSLVGLGLIVRRGSAARKAAIPFAPYLATGVVVVSLRAAIGVA